MLNITFSVNIIRRHLSTGTIKAMSVMSQIYIKKKGQFCFTSCLHKHQDFSEKNIDFLKAYRRGAFL